MSICPSHICKVSWPHIWSFLSTCNVSKTVLFHAPFSRLCTASLSYDKVITGNDFHARNRSSWAYEKYAFQPFQADTRWPPYYHSRADYHPTSACTTTSQICVMLAQAYEYWNDKSLILITLSGQESYRRMTNISIDFNWETWCYTIHGNNTNNTAQVQCITGE